MAGVLSVMLLGTLAGMATAQSDEGGYDSTLETGLR
jgi:hypothetical protein